MNDVPDHVPPECLTCGYDLTGAPGPNCPECGEAMNLEWWNHLSGVSGRPATPWEVRRTLTAYLSTISQITSFSKHFARSLPANADVGAAWAFAWCTFGIAVAPSILAGAVMAALRRHDPFRAPPPGELLVLLIVASLSFAVAFSLLTLLTVCCLRLAGRPIGVPRHRQNRFWLVLVLYHSVVLAPMALAAICLLSEDTAVAGLYLAGFAFLAWWLCVPTVAMARTRSTVRSVLAYVALLPVIVFSIGVWVVTAMVMAMMRPF